MEVTGSCHCGAIKFKATVSEDAIVCHCEDCQVLSGSAFRINLKAEAESFIMSSGELKLYKKVAESGDIRVQAFCPACATPIYSSIDQNPKYIFIRIGSIKERSKVRPAIQIWKDSALCNFAKLENIRGSSGQQALKVK